MITKNKYSRPGTEIVTMKGIVVHWVANPNSTALANRNFFENRKHGSTGYGSAHEVIDLNGDIVYCIPENEMAYHVGSKTYTAAALERLSDYPNNCTYGIECTHPDWSGRMTDETYNSLVDRCITLCKKFGLTEKDIWLHQEVVGWKKCHKYFVDNPTEWQEFKDKVGEGLGVKDWQKELGEKAINELAQDGIISDPEGWINHLKEPIPTWLVWEMLNRINKGGK